MFTCIHHTVGPFLISCNRERIFLKVEESTTEQSQEVKATHNIEDASKFFIVRLDDCNNYFNIVYESSSSTSDDSELKEIVGIKPKVSMYLCASVDRQGSSCSNQHLQVQMDGKTAHSRMALHSRRSKHLCPEKLTEWLNEKEVFFINCQERRRIKLRKSSYLCVCKGECH